MSTKAAVLASLKKHAVLILMAIWITLAPVHTAIYAVGIGGAGGGSSPAALPGASGIVIVEEFYQ
jgi:hypothetical protein